MLQAGEEIDVWVVDRPLGQGGMGSVYRCHNREAKRILAAVKVLDVGLGRLPNAKARFVREAEILFALDHPNIVKVRNVRMDLATPYLEMEFVDGVSLETRIAEGATPPADALPLLRQVADALAYLHAAGVRHRDVKPSNILVQPSGVVKLVDFGIATEADGATLTGQGQTFGSVAYAPPEWLEPENLDPARWDIYSAGVVFYEVLTGKPAFTLPGTGTMQQQVVRMIAVKQRHPPLDPGPGIPAGLRALIRDMTHPHWQSRLGDARVVRERLASVDLSELDATAVATPRSDDTWYADVPAGLRPPAGATIVPGWGEPTEDRPPAPSTHQTREAPIPTTTSEGTLAHRGEAPSVAEVPAAAGSTAPSTRGRIVPVVVLGLLAVAGAAAWLATRPPPTRDVHVTLSGADAPIRVTLDGVPGTDDAGQVRFAAVAPGPHTLVAVVGEGCEGAEPPAWCGKVEQALTVDAGAEPLPVTVNMPASRRDVHLSFPKLAAGGARVTLDGGAEVTGYPLVLTSVPAGKHTFTWSVGTCTTADLGCGDACPPGCASSREERVVPFGAEPLTMDVDLTPPAVPAPVVKGAGAGATERPAAASRGAVSTAAFARWLAKHPEWQAEAARAAGNADAGYLTGWKGAEPPPDRAGKAMVFVSWAAASAYCAGHGGLAGVDDPPLAWTESATQPWHELRSADGRPAWRRSEGPTSDTSDKVSRTESMQVLGFRCKR